MDDLLELLTRSGGWSAGRGPLYQRLSSTLAAAIEGGNVTPGMRLPPERSLAAKLGVSRSTVVAAYEHLREEGLVERRQGSGTRIAAQAAIRKSWTREAELVQALDRNVLFRGIVEGGEGGIDFLGSHLPAPQHLSPALMAAANEEVAIAAQGHGYFPAGYPPLRQAIADYHTARGLPSNAAQVLVTNGAQQAISLANAFFVQRGEAVALENPTYPGAIDAATSVGAHALPLPVGVEGARVDALADVLANRSPRLVYLNPTFQNPTGTVMPAAARAEVARLVSKHQVVLIDDLANAELSAGNTPPPAPIAAWAPEAPILTVGSMSKLFWGGLRVGWIRAPELLIARLTRYKAVLDLGTSLPGQILALHLMREIEPVRSERRREMASRFRLVESLLSDLLASWSWTPPKGGLVIWARIPFGSARDLASVAQRRGVAVLAGPVNSVDLSFDNYIRLTVTRPPDVLTEGIRRLAESWADYAPRAEGRRGQLEVIV